MRKVLGLSFVLLAALLPLCNVEAELGDIAFTRKAAGTEDIPPAIFPHFLHRMQFKCYVCHDAIFPMKAGETSISMDEIREGKYCGACHNGRTAFQATFEACPRCHRR